MNTTYKYPQSSKSGGHVQPSTPHAAPAVAVLADQPTDIKSATPQLAPHLKPVDTAKTAADQTGASVDAPQAATGDDDVMSQSSSKADATPAK
jgi:hypothetical protein